MQRIEKHLREDDLENLVEENMDVEEEERSRKESSKSHFLKKVTIICRGSWVCDSLI